MALLSYLHSVALDFNVNMFAVNVTCYVVAYFAGNAACLSFTLATRHATFDIKLRGNRLSSLFMCRG